jgi:hypothetical protein
VRRLASPGTNGGSRRPLASRSGTPRLQASPDRRPSRNPARRHGSQAATGTMYPAPAFVGRVPSIRGLRGRPRRKPRRLYADQGYDFDKYRRLLWTATRRPPGPGARPRNAAAASRPAPSGDGRRRSGRGSRPPYIAPARDDGQAAASGPPGLHRPVRTPGPRSTGALPSGVGNGSGRSSTALSSTNSGRGVSWTGRCARWTRSVCGRQKGPLTGPNPTDRGKPGSKIPLDL